MSILTRSAWAVTLVALVVIGSGAVWAADEKEAGAWTTTLAVGATLTDGNSETMGVNGSLAAERNGDKVEARLGTEGNYGETTRDDGSTDKTTQNAKAFATVRRTFDGPYLYSDNSVFHDEVAAVDLRAILGAGGGWYAIDNDNTKLGLELGAAYIREELHHATATDTEALRVAERLEQKLSDTARLWQTVEYLPAFEDFADYLLNAEIGLEAALNSTLSLRVVAQDRYDSTPAAGQQNNDLSVITGLSCKL